MLHSIGRIIVNDKLERMWKEAVVAYPRIFLAEMRKTMKDLSQDSGSPGRDSKQGPHDYEPGAAIRPDIRYFVCITLYTIRMLWST